MPQYILANSTALYAIVTALASLLYPWLDSNGKIHKLLKFVSSIGLDLPTAWRLLLELLSVVAPLAMLTVLLNGCVKVPATVQSDLQAETKCLAQWIASDTFTDPVEVIAEKAAASCASTESKTVYDAFVAIFSAHRASAIRASERALEERK
jgi:hypothetical protein